MGKQKNINKTNKNIFLITNLIILKLYKNNNIQNTKFKFAGVLCEHDMHGNHTPLNQAGRNRQEKGEIKPYFYICHVIIPKSAKLGESGRK